jgi:FKBP-type peptidyl-prolyl cis-trans isomerase FkpA
MKVAILIEKNIREQHIVSGSWSKSDDHLRTFPCIFIMLLMLLLTGASCHNSDKGPPRKNPTEADLVQINKYLVKKDQQTIANFAARKGWEMQTTKTGLWYMIVSHGNGAPATEGNIAVLNYAVYLLDGTLCYSSDSLGVKKFRIGQGNVETGLEEGVLLLRQGDKARFIMPPYLSHGLLGDSDKIPARSIILYEVELLAIHDTGNNP